MTAAPDRRWPPAWADGLVQAEVDETALYLALEAGGWPGELPVAARRGFALLVLASCEARQDGSTRLSLGAELEARLLRLGAPPGDRAAALELAARGLEHPALAPLVGRLGDLRPFLIDGGHLYHQRDLLLEERVADALAARVRAGGDSPSALPLPAAGAGRSWTPSQAAAIRAALGLRLAVITGGPGSGKTAVIGGIVRAWRAQGLAAGAIAVAAPTGKAANRAAEALAADGGDMPLPSTLHRLLGYAPRRGIGGGELRHHPNNPLPHAAVVVDEASMVDLALLDQLLRALRAEARLVLVGDAGQLPAIAAGSVFRDLAPLAIRLTDSHRMSPASTAGAEILAVARAIATGEAPAATPVPEVGALRFAGFELIDPGEGSAARRRLAAFLDRWYDEQVRLPPELDPGRPLEVAADGRLDDASAARAAAVLDHHRRARLLTVTRVGRAGAERVNEELARRAALDLGVPPAPEALPPGAPIMVIENDYDRGLMNGDQGAVLPVQYATGRVAPVAVFAAGAGFALFPLATLRGFVRPAYAITVHKAQGSEADHAALLLPDADMPLLSRELIYTAATRARAAMVVVGRPALLAEAVARPLGRSSGLADRLAARGALPDEPSAPAPRRR
ncbi:MAG TPA: AAA family ATPase [Polyangia bacterium]|nr:AAA family ATPase [Polyangia bacterium]